MKNQLHSTITAITPLDRNKQYKDNILNRTNGGVSLTMERGKLQGDTEDKPLSFYHLTPSQPPTAFDRAPNLAQQCHGAGLWCENHEVTQHLHSPKCTRIPQGINSPLPTS